MLLRSQPLSQPLRSREKVRPRTAAQEETAQNRQLAKAYAKSILECSACQGGFGSPVPRFESEAAFIEHMRTEHSDICDEQDRIRGQKEQQRREAAARATVDSLVTTAAPRTTSSADASLMDPATQRKRKSNTAHPPQGAEDETQPQKEVRVRNGGLTRTCTQFSRELIQHASSSGSKSRGRKRIHRTATADEDLAHSPVDASAAFQHQERDDEFEYDTGAESMDCC